MTQYEEITRDIRVSVKPVYLDDQSNPEDNQFLWAYHIRIDNTGTETVQLRSRYWHITDALGRVQEVRGPGVVGEQPTLAPGQHFEYASACPLPTPSGIMRGHFAMETVQGENFEVAVPAFSLDSPYQPMRLN